ncbi:hypothetical protein HZS_7291 [Henneguya salminicola]|nr:hypothetical protein HZS_7291 [Henneguya salminicola]
MSEYNLLVSSNDLKSAIDGEFHIEELLKQKSLDDIVRLEDNLNCGIYVSVNSLDIKVLDSQMKNLVYENYNKLIQTSEIMQNMSSEFDEAQKKLILLENELINGFQQSTSLMAALKPYQQKYRNYQRSKCDLLLIEKIFALPDQLQKHLDAHAFANFIQHYEACIDTIEELAHHNNIAIVKDKIDQIVIKARKFLTNEITMESEELRLDTKNVSENFRYLNKLGGSSEDVVKIIQKMLF